MNNASGSTSQLQSYHSSGRAEISLDPTGAHTEVIESFELADQLADRCNKSNTGAQIQSDTIADEISLEIRGSISELPPVDRGRGAWGYLIGAFLVEGLCWGFISSFGLFQNYLRSQERFKDNGYVSNIGTASSGLAYLLAPFSMRLSVRFPRQRTRFMYSGLVLCTSASLAASYCDEIWQLILTQGALFGIGTTILYVPTVALVNEWFVQRRGLACGIIFGGTGVFGLILPLLFEKSLESVGYANTLRIWAALMFLINAPTIQFLVKGRLPPSQATASRRLDLSFMKQPLFICVAISNLLQGMGYFVPSIYLPSYATDLRMKPIESTSVLSLLNLASVFGQILLGFLGDRIGPSMPLFLSTSVATLSVYLLWGLSKNFVSLMMFSVVYGMSAGGYSVLWSKFSSEIASDDPVTQLTIWGFFTFERGIGNIIAGPISAALIKSDPSRLSYAISKYEGTVIYTGVAMIVSTLGAFATFFAIRKGSSR